MKKQINNSLYLLLLMTGLLITIHCTKKQAGVNKAIRLTDEDSTEQVAQKKPSVPAVKDTVASIEPPEPPVEEPEPEPETEEPAEPGWTVRNTTREHSVREAAYLTRIRTGLNQGYDRIVYEFKKDIPPYQIEYVDEPRYTCGEGKAIYLEGDGVLEVRFTSTNAHSDEGVAYVTERDVKPGLPNVRHLILSCDFEAHVNSEIGVRSPNKYRVMELRNPTRLVIDIKH
jgi:hypothetical protein